MAFIKGSQIRPELARTDFSAITQGAAMGAQSMQQGVERGMAALSQGIKEAQLKKEKKRTDEDAFNFIKQTGLFKADDDDLRKGISSVGSANIINLGQQVAAARLAQQQLEQESATTNAALKLVNKNTDPATGVVNPSAVWEDIAKGGLSLTTKAIETVNSLINGRALDPRETAKNKEEGRIAATISGATNNSNTLREAFDSAEGAGIPLTTQNIQLITDTYNARAAERTPKVEQISLNNGDTLLVVNGKAFQVQKSEDASKLVLDKENFKEFQEQYPSDKFSMRSQPNADGTFTIVSLSTKGGDDLLGMFVKALTTGNAGNDNAPVPPGRFQPNL